MIFDVVLTLLIYSDVNFIKKEKSYYKKYHSFQFCDSGQSMYGFVHSCGNCCGSNIKTFLPVYQQWTTLTHEVMH